MRRNFTREEVEALILDLGSEEQDIVDLAMRDLLMSNPRRHLSDLIEALQWGDDIIKQRICYIFGGLLDERCVDPLLSMLQDVNVDTKLAAIDSLQYFPTERIIPYLKNQLQHEDEDVRDAIIATLGAFVKYGVVNAHLPLVEIVQSEKESVELRRSALVNLQHLDEEELKPILDVVQEISDATIYSHVLLLQDGLDENKEQKLAQIEQLINKLTTEKDILKQIRIEDRLVEGGALAVKVLIRKIFEEPDNTPLRVHVRMLIEKMGSKTIAAFKALFESFDRFDDIMQVVMLQDLIALMAQRKYATLASPLVKLLHRINSHIKQLNSESDRREFDHVKSDIHFALATYGCRDAVDDLKAVMRDGTERNFLELIQALAYIGDRDFLIPLINQHQLYRNFKRPSRIVKQAFKAIVKREKIKRNDPIFNHLSELQKENLNLMMKQ